MTIHPNTCPAEIKKFNKLAHTWWDRNGQFKTLHDINPVRLEWITERVGSSLQGKCVLDIGCGGGILAESLAQSGANVTGIDLSSNLIEIARLHQLETGSSAVNYHHTSADEFVKQYPNHFDIVTCMEVLEHVPNPQALLIAAAQLTKPGGQVLLSTLDRTLTSYLTAILGAEYILNILPKGTHNWSQFIRPAELSHYARHAGLRTTLISGLHYNPFTRRAQIKKNVHTNYLMATELCPLAKSNTSLI